VGGPSHGLLCALQDVGDESAFAKFNLFTGRTPSTPEGGDRPLTMYAYAEHDVVSSSILSSGSWEGDHITGVLNQLYAFAKVSRRGGWGAGALRDVLAGLCTMRAASTEQPLLPRRSALCSTKSSITWAAFFATTQYAGSTLFCTLRENPAHR
jgi:hypothetical protein